MSSNDGDEIQESSDIEGFIFRLIIPQASFFSQSSEKPEKISKNFTAMQFLKKVFQAFFQTNDSFFDMAVMEFFGPYEPINTLEALSGDFGDFDFAPETEFSTLTG